MKKILNLLLNPLTAAILLPSILLSVAIPVFGQQKDDATIKEYVEVVNVEMTLRALRKGQPVGGLKASDFILLEDGKELKITSFTELRKKIGRKEVELETDEPGETVHKKRFFLMYFWIMERRVKFRESLDYFFNNVYRDGDLVLMAVNNKAIKVTESGDIPEALTRLEGEVVRVCNEQTQWLESTARQLSRGYGEYAREALGNAPDLERLKTLRMQLRGWIEGAWQQFRYKFLTGNTTKLLALADSLKSVGLEKWGIVYYQQNVFPLFDSKRMEDELRPYADSDLELAEEKSKMLAMIRPYIIRFSKPPTSLKHIKAIQQAFIRSEATFHLMMPDSYARLDEDARSLVLRDVYSDWKETFRQITVATGGEVIGGNILKASLQKVVEREDIYYRLTYRPRNADKEKRKIRIEARQKDVKLFHVSRVKVDKPQNITMSDVSFENRILSIKLNHYHRVALGDRQMGDVQLVVSWINEAGEILEYMKNLELETPESTISMKLNLPREENCKLTITVWDNLSGLKAEQTIHVNGGR